jgi:hypothetical protein
MAAWTDDELARLGSAEERTLKALRQDGTLRAPVQQKYGRRYPTIVPRSSRPTRAPRP